MIFMDTYLTFMEIFMTFIDIWLLLSLRHWSVIPNGVRNLWPSQLRSLRCQRFLTPFGMTSTGRI
jgi:hypothetical protein